MKTKVTGKKIPKIMLLLSFLSFVGFIIYITRYLLQQPTAPYGISRYIPGGKEIDIIVFIGAPIIGMIFTTFIATRIVRLYVKFAWILKGGKYKIAIQEYKKIFNAREMLIRIFFASLLAISLGMFLNNTLYELGIQFIEGADKAYSSAALSMIFTPISILFTLPAWLLEDAGIIFFRKKNLHESIAKGDSMTEAYDITSIGTFYGYLFRGFAGITTPVLYIYSFIADIGLNRFELISVVLMFTPIFLMGILVLAYWLYIQNFPRLKEKFTHRGKFKVLDLNMELR